MKQTKLPTDPWRRVSFAGQAHGFSGLPIPVAELGAKELATPLRRTCVRTLVKAVNRKVDGLSFSCGKRRLLRRSLGLELEVPLGLQQWPLSYRRGNQAMGNKTGVGNLGVTLAATRWR